jgi:hypothetical protein
VVFLLLLGGYVPFDPPASVMFVTTTIVFGGLLAGVDVLFTALEKPCGSV